MLPKFRDFTLGDFKVTTLLASSTTREDPHSIFGLDVDEETFEKVSRENFLPSDMARFFFTPVLVDTGRERVLFDTGLNPDGVTEALSAAGYVPDDITHVVLTHMHGDHIGGLMDDSGNETFSEAAYLAGRVEYDAWAGMDNETFQAKVAPLTERMAFLIDGDKVLPGITAIGAFGHTPGHMAFILESAGRQLLLMADTANHFVYSLGHPDWEVSFDMDKEQAKETRRRILGMAAAERLPVIGYHMPFPAAGFVEKTADGFRWVAHSYQLM